MLEKDRIYCGDSWDIAVAQNKRIFTTRDGREINHPAVFPIELPMRHIQSWTNEGDIVLDPFMGERNNSVGGYGTQSSLYRL